MRSFTAYRSFLPKPKPTGWTVGQTWQFCVIANTGAWVAVFWIIAAALS